MTHHFLKRSFNFFRIQIQWLVILASVVLLHTGYAAAVNLVPNPSFESMTSCPTGLSSTTITGVTMWTAPTTGSPDYFNSCAPGGSGVSTPSNDFGSQAPHSGQAYAGFILRPNNDYREYLEVPLTAPLVASATYNVSFYVSLSDVSQWGIDKIGAYFSVGSVGPVGSPGVLSFTPQVINPTSNFITDKSNWTLISGTYVAAGGETHLVLGNFSDNASTTTITGLGGFYPGSYYYVDDVSVDMITTAAAATIGGRVMSSDGKGISKAVVTMTDANGAAHQVLTNPFGYYSFDGVSAGGTVIISVRGKKYTFGDNPRVVTVSGDLTGIDFVSAQ